MKKLLRISIMLFLLLILLFFTFNASPVMSKQDEVYIEAFIREWKMTAACDSCHRDFDSEIRFISMVQDSVIKDIQHEQVSFSNAGNIRYYYENRKRFCFDRALLLEMLYRYYGFNVRHVFVYFRDDNTETRDLDFLKRKIYSHAMIEVKTQKGWMAVGTNHNWIGLDKTGQVLDIGQIRKELTAHTLTLVKNPVTGTPFFASLAQPSNYKFVYGLYSRHGEFLTSNPIEKWMHKAGIPSFIPDYNIRALCYNF